MTMIQPGQQPMQIGPNQYVQAAQMQPRSACADQRLFSLVYDVL